MAAYTSLWNGMVHPQAYREPPVSPYQAPVQRTPAQVTAIQAEQNAQQRAAGMMPVAMQRAPMGLPAVAGGYVDIGGRTMRAPQAKAAMMGQQFMNQTAIQNLAGLMARMQPTYRKLSPYETRALGQLNDYERNKQLAWMRQNGYGQSLD